jgi:hypothetical protein
MSSYTINIVDKQCISDESDIMDKMIDKMTRIYPLIRVGA